jgi:hypothetical protein
MALRALLIERQAALLRRWQDGILAEYGEATAARWRRVRDPFANPVGHALAAGLPALFASLLEQAEPSEAAAAAAFLLPLRDAVREELAPALEGGAHAEDLRAFERRVETMTLAAFDTYVRVREHLFRVRQDELKRSVASLLRRWHGGELPDPGPGQAGPAAPAPRGEPR